MTKSNDEIIEKYIKKAGLLKEAQISDLFKSLGILALALPPTLGFATGGIVNYMTQPTEGDFERLRKKELLSLYKRYANASERRINRMTKKLKGPESE